MSSPAPTAQEHQTNNSWIRGIKLQTQIRSKYVISNFPPGGGEGWKYLPQNCIRGLVTPEAIKAELNSSDSKLIEWILNDSSKLFLITVNSQFVRTSAELLNSMRLFRSFGFDDSQLPWSSSSAFPDKRVEAINDTWTRADMIEYFPGAQWKLMALVIKSSIFTYKVQPEEILPFTRVTGEKPKEGAFGKVYRVKIQESHTDYHFEEIAVKEIQAQGTKQESALERAWLAEVGILKMVKDLQNPHIIQCLAAIERGDSRYLLFPWADGGSLRDYWEAKSHQTPTQHLVKEAILQIRGLAVALRQLHYFGLDDNSDDGPDELPHANTDSVADEYLSYGAATSIRHGDLKPENLLWFSQDHQTVGKYRCLKIADMGLAKRHVVLTQDRSRLTATTYGTILYEAPEAEPAFGQQPRSRLYDIWSMGCIIVEWVIWILYGNDQLQRFYSDLKGPNHDPKKPVSYYIINPSTNGQSPEPELHPQVVHWISHMRDKHPECKRDSAIAALLRLVREKLLVFHLPDRRLTTMSRVKSKMISLTPPTLKGENVRYRATSVEFERAMDDILEKVNNVKGFLLTSTAEVLSTVSYPPPKSSMLHPGMAVSPANSNPTPPGLTVQHLGPPTPSARVCPVKKLLP